MFRKKWRTRYLAEKLRADEADRMADALRKKVFIECAKVRALEELNAAQDQYIKKLEERLRRQDAVMADMLGLGKESPGDTEPFFEGEYHNEKLERKENI